MVDTSLRDALTKALGIAAAPTIDLSGDGDISLGWSADLRVMYAENVPGRAYLRDMPTIIPVATLVHMRKKPPKENRLKVVQRRSHLICQAIQSPTLVNAPDRYIKVGGFYRQACAARDENDPNCWLLVALSLAQLSGRNTQYHRVVTIHPANPSNFYDTNGQLIPRWMNAQ